METYPNKIGDEGVVRRSGEVTPFNAGDAIAAVLDRYGQPIPSTLKARLGKAAKELLDDGFDPQTVCAALYGSVLRARPDLAQVMALEIQNARGGRLASWKQWQRGLSRVNRAAMPELEAIRRGLQEAFK